ncbi:hypothetical protein NsoK4_04970 [Nitrosopumilus sp. K4]|uniref:DUF6659 family protein n=1 Tax=Nitrosopumilus sp. K4 TaxID=2795383 RepID=UPI001BACE921|nr:DUF6659 family protein [Nitrosopumilus sp. K4]QUC65585.1 hypothetical protein NsoK4_04970 [Nitrosopumilus sp. K4]
MDFEKLCKDVMSLDSKIRFSMAVVEGKQKFGGYRFDTVGILDSDELEKSIWYAFERMEGRQMQEHKLGKIKYALAEYENVKRVTFPLEQKTMLLVSMDTDSNHDEIIKKILHLIHA